MFRCWFGVAVEALQKVLGESGALADWQRGASRRRRSALTAPTDLPEGSVVELVVFNDRDIEDLDLLAELAASARDETAGRLVDFDAAIARLGGNSK